jgi:hypothetical protein
MLLTYCANRTRGRSAWLCAERHAPSHHALHASCCVAAAVAAGSLASVAAQVALAGLVLVADVAPARDLAIWQAPALLAGVTTGAALTCTVTGADRAADSACSMVQRMQNIRGVTQELQNIKFVLQLW